MDNTAMSWREHIRQNIRLTLPLTIGQLATIGIWTSDTIAIWWIDSWSLAADRANLSRSAGATFWIGIAATAATMIILLIWPEFLIGLFLTSKDAMFAEVMALALPMLLLTALFQIPDGVQAIAMSVLRGVNDTRIPAIVAIASFWISGVAVGALAGFSLGFGPTGVWGGLLLGLSVASLILTMRMMRAMRRIRDGGRILLA